MEGLTLLLILFVLARGSGGRGAPGPDIGPAPPRELPPAAKRAAKMPPPWPQAMPSGLPPFGPNGWMPDNPPPQEVQARAWQLLASLWAKGAGAMKTEQTGGRWITYQAQPMAKGKKGVVAFRLRNPPGEAPPQPTTPTNIPMV